MRRWPAARGLPVSAAFVAVLAVLMAGCGPKPIFRSPGDGGSNAVTDELAHSGGAVSVNGHRVEEISSVWLGTPYRYGGVNHRGIDCSALAQNVLGDLGTSLPRTVSAQRKFGRAVSPGDLKAGDLVFFRLTSSRADHVGIVLDPNRFIHASSSRGVVIDQMMDKYFSRRFVEARRIFEID